MENLISKLSGLMLYLRNREYPCEESVLETMCRILPPSPSETDIIHFMQPLAVRTKEQAKTFPIDVHSFFHPEDVVTEEDKKKAKEKQEKLEKVSRHMKNLKSILEDARLEQQKIEERINESKENYTPVPLVDEKVLQKGKRIWTNNVFRTVAKPNVKQSFKDMEDILTGKKLCDAQDIRQMMGQIPDLMIRCANHKAYVQELKFLSWTYQALKKAEKQVKSNACLSANLYSQLRKVKTDCDEYEKEIISLNQKYNFSAIPKQIQKLEAISHRPIFDPESAKNAVLSTSIGEPEVLHKGFKQLTKEDKRQVYAYILDNVRRFRTRMTKTIRSRHVRHIDLAQTIKKACGTDGIPIRLCYTKPKINKTKLVLFLDVSGSCREASELMLFFMYALQDVFPQGCESYVFVNKLYNVSQIFQTYDAEKALKQVFQEVPTRGVYSDYGVPFTSFYEEEMSILTKDSVVFFIGDARNNRRNPGEDAVKAIARRGKGAFWLNTDTKEKWDQGDSIIRIYAQYMDQTTEVRTPLQLIQLIENLRIKGIR